MFNNSSVPRRARVLYLFLVLAFAVIPLSATRAAPNEQAIATWCLAGSFQGWNNNSIALYDDGSNGDVTNGDGIYSIDYLMTSSGFFTWKISACDNWLVAYPVKDAWLFADSGDTIKFTFDTNSYSDGYYPTSNIVNAIGDNYPASFTAVGDWQGWSNTNPATEMTDLGGGIHQLSYIIPTAGSYVGKVSFTGFGDWHGFGIYGREIDAHDPFHNNSISFQTTTPNEEVIFTLNLNWGRLSIDPQAPPPDVWDSVYHSSCHNRVASTCAGDGNHAAQEDVPGFPAGTKFSSANISGGLVGTGVTDVYVYDDENLTLYMLGDTGALTDDGTYPQINAWVGSALNVDMSFADSITTTFRGRTSDYTIYEGSLPPQRPMEVYYGITAQDNPVTGTRSLCMTGGQNNLLGQAINSGGCAFIDYAYAVIDDDTSAPNISNLAFNDGGDGLGNNNDEVCADVVENVTDSGDNDSAVGQVTVRFANNLGDVVAGNGLTASLTFTTGSTYCNSTLNFSDATYYRVEASNDDQDHADAPNYTDIDSTRTAPACEGASCSFPATDNDIHWDEIVHNTRDLQYRAPFGAVQTGSSPVLTLQTMQDDVQFVFLQLYNTPTGNKSYGMAEVGTMGGYDYFQVAIPPADTASGRQLYYKFLVIDGTDEDWYIDDWSHNEYDHEDRYENGEGQMVDDGQAAQYINNSFTMTVYDATFAATVPAWAQNAVIYQIMPDRFRNGDPDNDTAWPSGYTVYGNTPFTHSIWNEAPVNPRDILGGYHNFWSADFFGGDIQGVMDELDYLQSIGVTAIYLNPVFSSPSNHGYDTTNYLKLNPRYGDNELFEIFAQEAENRGIKIILDGVFNHTGSDSVYFDRYHRWGADGSPSTALDGSGACEAASSPYASFFDFIDNGTGPCYDGNNYESWFGYDSLPILRDYIPGNSVRDFVFDVDNDGDNGITGDLAVIQYWDGLGVDGWRFDVANEIPHDFWQEYRNQVKLNDGIMGPLYTEVWYEAQPWLLGNELDSTMNYRYRKAVLGFLIDSTWTDNDSNGDQTMHALSPEEFDYVLNSIREDYPPTAWYSMMNLMGSHDTNRALFVLSERSGDLATAHLKLKMMAALQFTYPGAPTIYYGDEAGLGAADYGGYGNWGAGYEDGGIMQDDPYNRHTYPWSPDDENNYNTWTGSGTHEFNSVTGGVAPTDLYTEDLRLTYSILATTRNNYPVLRTGDVTTLLADNGNIVYAYARTNGTDCAIAIFNRSAATKNVSLSNLPGTCTGTFYDVLNAGAQWTPVGSSITVNNVPAYGSAVLVRPLGVNNLVLPLLEVSADANDVSIATNGSTLIEADAEDIVEGILPANVTVNFTLISGTGSLSAPTAITDGTGVASVTYNAGGTQDIAVIQASITAPNGVTYSGSTTVYVGYGANVIENETVETKIGPDFVDELNPVNVAVTKIGNGEPVVSLGQFDGNPYTGANPVASPFVDVHLTDATDVDMLAIQIEYTVQTSENSHLLYYWTGTSWATVSSQYLDTINDIITFEATATSTPSLATLTGTVFVVGLPGNNVTDTPTATFTPSNTPTPTLTPTSTGSVTPTFTPSITLTPSLTPSNTATNTPVTPTLTPSNTATHTPVTPTLTPSITPTATCAISVTPPNLISPQHRTHTTDRTPTFTWSNVAGARSYRLMVYTEDRSFEYKKRVFTRTYTLTAAEALSLGKYLWRVRTQDQGCSTWSKWSTRNTLFID